MFNSKSAGSGFFRKVKSATFLMSIFMFEGQGMSVQLKIENSSCSISGEK